MRPLTVYILWQASIMAYTYLTGYFLGLLK